jgi:hypothetical protein
MPELDIVQLRAWPAEPWMSPAELQRKKFLQLRRQRLAGVQLVDIVQLEDLADLRAKKNPSPESEGFKVVTRSGEGTAHQCRAPWWRWPRS